MKQTKAKEVPGCRLGKTNRQCPRGECVNCGWHETTIAWRRTHRRARRDENGLVGYVYQIRED